MKRRSNSIILTTAIILLSFIISTSLQAAIIADHNIVNEFESIPDSLIYNIHDGFDIYYVHTSHGSQIMTGLALLEDDSVLYSHPPFHEVSDDLGATGDTSWVPGTRTYLNTHPECNMAMFSWCGGVSGNTEEGINIYLNKMVELETDYPERIFIYMTGHLDGGGPTGNLYLRNNQIRDFCNANDKILFDFADIESYDPDGNYFPDGSDGCEWCYDWCLTQECPSCDCAHSQCFNCYLKGKAWWWMMATIMSWNSIPDVSIDMIPDSPPVTVTQGGSFTFTGILTNNTDQPQVTDVAIFLDVPTIGAYGPLDIFHNIYLAPNDTIIYTGVMQEVPGYAILGDYDYKAYCGDYPNNPMDSASFPFTVTTALKSNIAGDWDLTSWFEPANSVLPEKSRLIGNYPNPFNANTTISFELADESNAALTIYDILGRKVTTISDGYFLAGVHNIPWDASDYSSGIYFYGLTTDGRTTTGRMTLLK